MAFRSRGIRYDIETKDIFLKEYYDPDDDIVTFNKEISEISKYLRMLEYSINSDGIVDSINFNTSCKDISDYILVRHENIIMKNIGMIFDSTYRAYTIGYRIQKKEIKGVSIYYYPTILKGNRYGICGITDRDKIYNQILRFCKKLDIDPIYKNLILSYIPYITKFKGCCITLDYDGNTSYKLYIRMDENNIKKFFSQYLNFENYKIMYGDVVLIAIRLSNKKIKGFNFYYIR